MISSVVTAAHSAGKREASMEQVRRSAIILSEIGADPAGLRPEVWKLIG